MRGRNPWTRKLGALVMALALCVGLLPVSALAAEPPDPSITDIPEGLVIEGTVVTDYTGTATELTIPNGVTEIGRSAFNGNETLESVTLPDTVTIIGQFAFSDAEKLTSITMPGATTVENYAFQRIKTLESISMPEVTTIGKDAFRGATALSTVSMPEVITIGEQAFNETAITKIDLPEVLTIGERAFYNAPLANISAPKVTSIGSMAFASTAFTAFVLPESVTTVGESILNNCKNLQSLSISLNVLLKATFHDRAFANTFNTYGEYEIILTGVNQDVTLLNNGIQVGEKSVTFPAGGLYDVVFHITKVEEATSGTVTNETGETVTVNGTTVVNGSVKPVGVNTDAYLSTLALDGAILEPTFTNVGTEYTSFVDYTVDTIRVQAIPSDSEAGVTVNSTAANTENDYIVTVPLQEGENTISVVVTSQDSTAQKTYTITLTRNPKPNDLVLTTAQELMDFAAAVNNGDYTGITDVTVALGGDIDMTGYDWTPIGIDGNHYFSGTFEGNGYTIRNLTISKDTTGYFGLFGITNATIQNVNLTGSLTNTISDARGSYVGAVAGYIIGGAVRNCNTSEFTIKSSSDDLTLGLAVGGIVGVAESTQVENCVSGTDITLNFSYCYIGGVAGAAVGSQVVSCTYIGTLTLMGSDYADCGGIVGNNQQGSEISYCVNQGKIDVAKRTSAINAKVGGIVGRQDDDTDKVAFCTNEGSVKGKAYYMGGIAGYASSGSIENCLNKGDVESTDGQYTGGIAGSSSGPIQTCVVTGTVTASTGTRDPIVASGNGTREDNYFDETIFSGTTTTGKAVDVNSQDFVNTINGQGGNYRLNEDGKIEVTPILYTLTVVGSEAAVTGAGEYEAGAQVSIDAGERPGYHFAGWTATVGSFSDPSSPQTTFTMPGEAVTITANWTEIPPYIPPANPNYKITVDDTQGGTVVVTPTSAKAGTTVTLTPVPDQGFALDTLAVTDRFGDAVRVTENSDGTYTFTMPNGQVTVKATFVETEEPAPAEPFPDVDENDWFYDEVVYVYENGLMNGVENNQFAPNTATNRAMLATILYRLAGEPAVSGDLPFTDVESGTWYTDAVLWAAQNGIVNGLGENTFAPMNTLTREQLVTMLYRYAEAEGYDVSAAADLSGYPDADKVQTYAQEAMSWAVAEGIVEGMDGNLNPAGSATRAQIATILMRFCEGVAK